MSEQLRLAMDDDATPPARLLLCGVGGGGVNALNNYLASTADPIETLAVESDRRALQRSAARRKVALLGPVGATGKVWGTGGDPAKGRALALGATNEILAALQGADLLFLAASLGGGTGSGAAPVIANLAAQANILTIAVLTLPRRGEGAKPGARAQQALQEIRAQADAVLVVENDRIFMHETAPIPLMDAFRKADEVLARAVIALTEIIHGAGYINIDFADVERTLRHRGGAVLGIGRGRGPQRLTQAFKAALEHPFVQGNDISRAQSALFNLRGDPTANDLDELEQLRLSGGVGQDFKFGIIPDIQLGDELELTIVAAGIPVEGIPAPALTGATVVASHLASISGATVNASHFGAAQHAAPLSAPNFAAPAKVSRPPEKLTPPRFSPLPPLGPGAVSGLASAPAVQSAPQAPAPEPVPEPAGLSNLSNLSDPSTSFLNPITPGQIRTEVITSLPMPDSPAAPTPGSDPREVPAYLRRRRETV